MPLLWQSLQQIHDRRALRTYYATVIPRGLRQMSLGVLVDQKNSKCNQRHLRETPSRFLTG